jgi:hypothetical protein
VLTGTDYATSSKSIVRAASSGMTMVSRVVRTTSAARLPFCGGEPRHCTAWVRPHSGHCQTGIPAL